MADVFLYSLCISMDKYLSMLCVYIYMACVSLHGMCISLWFVYLYIACIHDRLTLYGVFYGLGVSITWESQ